MVSFDKIDQFVIETVFNDNGAIKGFTILDQQQKKVINNNKRVAVSNREVASTGFALGKAFRTIGAYLGIREISRYADEWTNIKSILSLVTAGEEERLRVQERLFNISQDTRQNMMATVDLYRRITTATETLGLSEQKRLQITEAINKAIIIGGGSAASNQAALVQLGQGLASGQLRGQELNSILEQSPRLARMIAEGMGLQIGQLRTVAAEGGLTPDKVLNAILNQAPKVNQEFQKMDKTIGQAFVTLSNSVGKFLNRLNEMTGASKVLAEVIVFLAKNIDTVATIIFAAFIPSIVKAIPLLDLFFLNLASGMGIFSSIKFAIIASLPAMKAFAIQAWAMSAPFLKIIAVIELAIQTIKMLKGEWNWYAEAIDSIERGTYKALNYIGRETGWWEERKQFNGTFSQGALNEPPVKNMAPINQQMANTASANQRMPNSIPANHIVNSKSYPTNNISQNININVNGARDPKITAQEINDALSEQIALGVMS